MTDVPLAFSDDPRTYAGLPRIALQNRFVEQNLATAKGSAMIARPGTDELEVYGDGPIRSIFSLPGLFGGAAFIASGTSLYRRDVDGTVTRIAGFLLNSGDVDMTGVEGAGYQHLFVADGSLLQVYRGPSQAAGVLTSTAQVADGDVVRIGATYYEWVNVVVNGAGAVGSPWRVLIGADLNASMSNLAAAINFTGTQGVTYSANLGGRNPDVAVTYTGLTLDGVPTTTAGIATTAWNAAELLGAAQASGTLTATAVVVDADVVRTGTTYYRFSDAVADGAGTVGSPWRVLIGTQASGALSATAQVADADVVRIGSVYYRWVTTVSAGTGTVGDPWKVLIGATLAASFFNMDAAINATGTAGTTYSAGLTAANTTVFSVNAGVTPGGTATMAVTARSSGTGGNSIETTTTGSVTTTWAAVTLTGGDASLNNSFSNLRAAINFTGTPGEFYSGNMTTRNPQVSATYTALNADGEAVLTANAQTGFDASNTIETTTTGTATTTWAETTLTGGTRATGVLTSTLQVVEGVRVRVGTYHYIWVAIVANGAGTEADPWRVVIGADLNGSVSNMVAAIGDTGTAGTEYSANLTGANLQATATYPGLDAEGLAVVTFTARAGFAEGNFFAILDALSRVTTTAGNTVDTTTSGSSTTAWATATLTGGGANALNGVAMPDGLPPIAVATLKSFVLVAIGNSDRFYWIRPAEITIAPLDFATAESQPDDVLTVEVVGDTAWFVGEGSTEVWYATGVSASPFAPVPGRVFDRGAIEGTVVNIKGSVFLVGRDYVVYAIAGAPNRISNHGVEQTIRTALEA